jgi:murein DD-endopeptidase MepM/ murein hydrolase activator NlpD
MPHEGHRYSRAQLAQEANLRAQIPSGAVTFAWRTRGATRTGSLSFLALGTLTALGAVLSVWGVAITSYIAFKDDILAGVMNRQAAMQLAYEDRIRDLRGQVDRMTSRAMVDQNDLERRVDQVARRQAILETRQSIVTSLNESAGNVRQSANAMGMPVPVPSPLATSPLATSPLATSPVATSAARPQPVGDTLRLAPPQERQSRLESRAAPVQAAALPAAVSGGAQYALAATPSKVDLMARVERSLDQVELRQQAALQTLETHTERRARRIRSVLADLGLDAGRVASPPAASTAGTGGPLIPIAAPTADASPFERQVFRLQTVIRDHDRLNRLITGIPLGRPHSGELELSSGFGARLDPFLRSWAMHSGIDFRGTTGEPAFASASGRVVHASAMGGYGLMVEIDHGNGITTRYAHLSRIEVKEGDAVRLGQRVGRVGSTGRSTGPHLHYETRINGEAVDPMRFVRAGLRLAGAE